MHMTGQERLILFKVGSSLQQAFETSRRSNQIRPYWGLQVIHLYSWQKSLLRSSFNIFIQLEIWPFGIPSYQVDTILDFLCELGITPHMKLVDIIIFSLYRNSVSPTKIIKGLLKDLKILIFKVIFQCSK